MGYATTCKVIESVVYIKILTKRALSFLQLADGFCHPFFSPFPGCSQLQSLVILEEHHQNTGTGQGLHFTRDQSPNKPSELLRCPHNNAESLHLNAKAIVSFPSKIIKARSQKDQLVAVQTFVELSVQKPKVENERRAQPFSDLLEAAKQI